MKLLKITLLVLTIFSISILGYINWVLMVRYRHIPVNAKEFEAGYWSLNDQLDHVSNLGLISFVLGLSSLILFIYILLVKEPTR